jgi:hypothetical protein
MAWVGDTIAVTTGATIGETAVTTGAIDAAEVVPAAGTEPTIPR